MLKRLRENMKAILWITILAFVALIFLAWGMDIQSGRGPSPGTLARVNGRPVTRDEYEQVTRNTFDAYRNQFGQEPSGAEADGLRDQAWENLIQGILLTQEAHRREFEPTDEEILYSIKMDPPSFVRSMEIFQTDGVFDPEKYRESLRDPLMDWTPLESWVRSTLPMSKLQDLVMWGSKVSDPELKDTYAYVTEKRTISYAFIDPMTFDVDETSITEQQVRDYYSSHKEEFTEPEQAKVAYVFLELRPSAADSAEVLGDMARILSEIRGGEDFAEMAKIHSEDPSADSGGGDPETYFKKRDLRPEMAEVLFSLDVGEVSEPFLDAYGYHIVKLEDKKIIDGEEQVSFRQILKTVSPGRTTVDALWDKVRRIETSVGDGVSLKDAVAAEGLEVSETPYFGRQGFVPGLAGLPRAREIAFEMKVGEVRGPLATYKGHYFIELADKKPERLKPFEEVADDCRRRLVEDLRADMAYRRAVELSKAAASADSLEQIAEAESLEVRTAGPFTRNGFVPGIGRDYQVIGAAFAAQPGDPPVAVKGSRGSYLLRVDSAQPLDEEAFAAEKQRLKQRILQQKQNRAYTAWIKGLEEKAKIKDYRDKY